MRAMQVRRGKNEENWVSKAQRDGNLILVQEFTKSAILPLSHMLLYEPGAHAMGTHRESELLPNTRFCCIDRRTPRWNPFSFCYNSL